MGKKKTIVLDKDFEEIIPEFLIKRKTDIVIIQKALEDGDYSLVESLGHKLKGTCGSYGFKDLSEIGKKIEDAAKVRKEETIIKLIEKIENYLANIDIKFE
ncbi:Hpt domain-containing protein [Fluviispira multicolorata]|uniref:Hpt domain-containing protein n=1 Tax=Fluviispira multicolorata TaxID=2654512 RepID=A0A833JDM3_9BACT|nr:Hpt domain-containing protein [Fluviispira multicolorata]KAB8029066.1 Hpt domain-containing protein [Fluviispira multicolorata]